MKINSIQNPQINQNGYHKNVLTKERIGTLFIYPINFTPNDCLSCNGYSLQINDYEDLYQVIGKKFNQPEDEEGTFRIPDYNVSGRFLQPSNNAGIYIDAGLPNITGGFNVTTGAPHGCDGAFSNNKSGVRNQNSGSYNATREGATFDASSSSAIYGNSSTVQPPSQTVHICIKYK